MNLEYNQIRIKGQSTRWEAVLRKKISILIGN
jgi:hypothetical protein